MYWNDWYASGELTDMANDPNEMLSVVKILEIGNNGVFHSRFRQSKAWPCSRNWLCPYFLTQATQ